MAKKINRLITLLAVIMLFSCSKDPGSGGSSSIAGKVYVRDFNSTFTLLEDEYYGQEVDVYLIYGDDRSYADHVKTNYDGTYEFRYLRKGMYHVYAYSKDSTLQTNAMIPVIRDVEITANRTVTEVPVITIAD